MCSVGLASDTIRPKKSKSIDKRFDWVKCRVRQHQFNIKWIAGADNKADFFTKALPVHVHRELAPFYVTPPPSTAFSLAPVLRLISDTGATHVLLRRSSMPHVRHLFTPKVLPSLSFDLPDGGSLTVNGADGGALSFPGKSEPVECYICDDAALAHNLVGTSPLLHPDGHAIYTPLAAFSLWLQVRGFWSLNARFSGRPALRLLAIFVTAISLNTTEDMATSSALSYLQLLF